MNITERGIRGQFPYWTRAGATPFLADPAVTYGVVGCGTSVYIADALAATLCRRGIDARAVPGGEWISRRHDYLPHDSGLHMLALSRSGESTETVRAAAVSRAAGIAVTAVTCAAGSSLTRHADRVLMAETHPDEGIVMTASASLMLLMGLRFAGIEILDAVADRARQLMRDLDAALSPGLLDRAQFVFLGGGALYGIACEGALKLQEMSLSHTSAYHPLEYRHGPVIGGAAVSS
jgi:glucosamine--fructose-6-phosphate aminotransferase (isomerizing)